MPTTSESCRRQAAKIARYSKRGELPQGGKRELAEAFNDVVVCFTELDLALECRRGDCEDLKARYNGE